MGSLGRMFRMELGKVHAYESTLMHRTHDHASLSILPLTSAA
jgi:hypothetical protein